MRLRFLQVLPECIHGTQALNWAPLMCVNIFRCLSFCQNSICGRVAGPGMHTVFIIVSAHGQFSVKLC
jgi:hypothetical protein